MRNSDIADLFDELAERTALIDAKPFRAVAYGRAATLFRSLHVSAAQLAARGQLRELDGVGPAIEEKVIAALETGTFPALEKARAQVPDGLLELVRIDGVGEKTARRIWAELDAQTIDEVFAAARDGSLRELKGIGPKVVGAITAGEQARDQARAQREAAATGESDDELPSPALLRSEALAVVRAVELICKVAAHASGDFARGCELVHDLVVIVEGDREAVLSALADAGWEALAADAGSDDDADAGADRVRTPGDVVIDVCCIPPAADVEAQIISHAGPRAWASVARENVPPELRDAVLDGVVDADAIPADLVQVSDLVADLHDHSTWSDGTTDIIDLARAARDRGDSHLLISDHSAPYALVNGLDAGRLLAQAREIHTANELLAADAERDGAPPFLVLQGSEVEIRPDGELGLPDDVLASLDWVVASVHVSQRQSSEQIAQRMRRVCANPLVDCIGHPTSRLLLKRQRTALDIDLLIELARDSGKVLEINANPRRLDLDSDHARRALAAGVRLAINTDAHSIGNLDYRPHGVAVARRAGARTRDVVNTLDHEQLEAIRPRHR